MVCRKAEHESMGMPYMRLFKRMNGNPVPKVWRVMMTKSMSVVDTQRPELPTTVTGGGSNEFLRTLHFPGKLGYSRGNCPVQHPGISFPLQQLPAD